MMWWDMMEGYTEIINFCEGWRRADQVTSARLMDYGEEKFIPSIKGESLPGLYDGVAGDEI
jgi:hypothetical protein